MPLGALIIKSEVMRRGFSPIPIIVMVLAVMVFGLLAYFAVTSSNPAANGTPAHQNTNPASVCGNGTCEHAEWCTNGGGTTNSCGPKYCAQDCAGGAGTIANFHAEVNNNPPSNTNNPLPSCGSVSDCASYCRGVSGDCGCHGGTCTVLIPPENANQ